MTVDYRLRAAALFGAILGISPVLAQTAAAPAPAAAVPAPAPASAGVELKATLIGTNEVPGPGDPDGTGTAAVSIDMAQGKLCYTLMVANVEGVNMAHVHKAPMGSMGNVVVPLTAPTSGSSQGCAQVRPDLIADMLTNPGDYYVNVHSETFMAGAVRGQLGREEPVKPARKGKR
jgi:hypothetical protein